MTLSIKEKNRPKLKLFYTDFWDVWNMYDNYFTNILKIDFHTCPK